MNFTKVVETRWNKSVAECSNEELYIALLEMVKELAKDRESNEGKKKVYYVSAEFLIGKLLSNNLINLGIYDEVKETLTNAGKNLAEIEEIEIVSNHIEFIQSCESDIKAVTSVRNVKYSNGEFDVKIGNIVEQ